jgi:hypothetical protein
VAAGVELEVGVKTGAVEGTSVRRGTVGVPGPGLSPSGVPSAGAKDVGGRAVLRSSPGLLLLGVFRLPGLLLPPASGSEPPPGEGGSAKSHAIDRKAKRVRIKMSYFMTRMTPCCLAC